MKVLQSVRFKLLFVALLVVFIVNLLIVLSDVHETGKLLVAKEKENALIYSNVIEKSLLILMMENRWPELQTLMENFRKDNADLTEARIFLPASGRIIVSADKEDIGKTIYRQDWEKFVNQDYVPFVIQKKGGIFASRVGPIRNTPSCHRCHGSEQAILGVIDVEVSLANAEKALKEIAAKHFLVLMLGFVVISVVFFIGGDRLINRPLTNLMEAMKGVGTGALSVRVDEGRKDEFGYLAKGFNSMVSSLEVYQLRQMEKASKMASLGEIMSGIAHEVKNPLTGISCAIQVLNSEFTDGDRNKAVITEILNQIKRLDRTVKDLLSYAKPKTPQLLPSRISEIVEKATFLVYPEARKEHVVLEVDIGEDIPEIMADPDQLQQVILNLMINAVQAMPEGGKLTVSASVRRYDELKDDIKAAVGSEPVLVLSIKDTGKGIPPEDIENIFEPFFTRKTKGTGLGLSISQKIIQEHGGKITVRSEPGRGSEFSIYLPLRTEEEQEAVQNVTGA